MWTRTRSLLLLFVWLGLLASSALLPAGQPDEQVPSQVYRQLHRYLVPKLATLTEEQKLLFARKLWNRIHCRKVGTTKIYSFSGPWINDQDSLARILWNSVYGHIRIFKSVIFKHLLMRVKNHYWYSWIMIANIWTKWTLNRLLQYI